MAQALLEKAITIDQHYGQAHGCWPPAICLAFTWVGPKSQGGTGRRTRRAGGNRVRQPGPLGAQRAGQRVFFDAAARRFVGRVRTALRLNPNFSLAHGYYGLALTYCGLWQEAYEAARTRYG